MFSILNKHLLCFVGCKLRVSCRHWDKRDEQCSPQKKNQCAYDKPRHKVWNSQQWTRWWFHFFIFFYPYLGKWSNLTSIFQMGWNHQLVKDLSLGKDERSFELPLIIQFFVDFSQPKTRSQKTFVYLCGSRVSPSNRCFSCSFVSWELKDMAISKPGPLLRFTIGCPHY